MSPTGATSEWITPTRATRGTSRADGSGGCGPAAYAPVAPFNLRQRTNQQLVQLLGDSRKWYRDHARRLLGERRDRSLVPQLRRLARESRGQLALEALWTANLISGIDSTWALELLDHPDAPVRSWTLQLLNSTGTIARPVHERMVRLARTERDAEVRSELASTAGRFQARETLDILQELIGREEDVPDRHIPLRLWWTLEDAITRDARRRLGLAREIRGLAIAALHRTSRRPHRPAAGRRPR